MEEYIQYLHVLAALLLEVYKQVFWVFLLVCEQQAFEQQDNLDIRYRLVYLAEEHEVVEAVDILHFLSSVNQGEILIWYQL